MTEQEQKHDVLLEFKLITQSVGYRDIFKRRRVYSYIEKSLKRDEELKQIREDLEDRVECVTEGTHDEPKSIEDWRVYTIAILNDLQKKLEALEKIE